MKLSKILGTAVVLMLVCATTANAQTWQLLNNQPGPGGTISGVGALLQLRDGRIIFHHEDQAGAYTDWWILTPDAYGSYVNGTWSPTGLLPSNYAPTYFGSQHLINASTPATDAHCPVGNCGQVVIEGGEYNFTASSDTNLGALATYQPWGPLNWVANAAPKDSTGATWRRIGDAASITLANGRYMQTSCCDGQTPAGGQFAIYNGPNSWLVDGNGKQSSTDESGLTLLTNDLVLMVDAKRTTACGTTTAQQNMSSELYTMTNLVTGQGTWACGPTLVTKLWNNADEELGVSAMLYNNKVLQIGGSVIGTNIYDVATNSWSLGPNPPDSLDQSDGPGAIEPNGKLLVMMSPGLFLNGCYMLEYDPTANSFAYTGSPQDCTPPSTDTSYSGHLMIVPTGQIIFSAFVPHVEMYTPAPGLATWTCNSCNPIQTVSIPATILLSSTILHSGSLNNVVYGYQLNGLTQNNFYGDDNQMDTNFPLARITCANVIGNGCTPGYVYYAFTHDDGPAGPTVHSIAPHHFGYTKFDLPVVPAGTYDFQTVTNGIPSNSIRVTVQ